MTSPTFDNNAFAMLEALLKSWGLDSLSGNVRDMMVAGDTADVIPIKLRETDAYKKRFKGNADRLKNGLPALSEAEYLATETSLKSVIRRYVGTGEYDTTENLEKWIAGDLSPQELNDRMSDYQQQFMQQPQWVKDAWSAEGFTPQDAIKSVMDPNVTETSLKRRGQVYALGSQAAQAFGDRSALNTERLGELVDAGVTAERAADGYRQVAGREKYEGFLARTAGVELSREEQENAALLGDQGAEQKRRKVLATDEARFTENYLGTQASLARDRSGSY